ncbi:protein angel homolog 2-like isoform X4 [Physella acuta]|uniref:protein angel homolog 2-like isoform X4 n=1 Tax=Physella acuta TaxID=109671 RepID=UPI0027DE674B|nr:protein angel homolog 2-like isoform X4 [Physella acuta]
MGLKFCLWLIKNKLRTSTVLFLDVACHRGACSANVRVPLYEDMEGTTTKAEASGAKFKNHFFAAETDSNTRPKIHASESERGTIKFSLKPAKYGVKKQPPAVNTVTEKTSIHVASAVSYVRSVASEMSVISEQKTRIVDGPGLKKSHTSDKAYSSSFSSSKWKQTTVEKKGSSPIKTTEVTKDLSENYISSSSPVKASNKNRDQYHVSEIGVTSEKSLADGPKHQQHDRPKRSRSFFSPDEKSVSQKKHVIERSDQYVSTNYHRSLFKQTEATYTSASETLQSTSENCEGLYNYSNQGERTLNTSESSRNTWQYSEHVQNNDDFKISEGNNPISDREHDKKKKKRRTKPPKELTHRKWEYVGSQDSSRTGMEFTVMTYNILSQELLVQHPYLYRECRERDIDWANRCSLLIRQILTHNADIICLQEVQEDHWHHDILRPLVKNGYKGVYKKKVDDKVDGCAILYKHSKFRQLNFIPVEFKRGGILDRDNVGIILLLQPLQAGRTCQKICVATTHLLFNPRRGDVKLAQLMVFLAEIDKYAHETHKKLDKPGTHSGSASTSQPEALNYCPIILCGDFNSTPASDLYDLIIRGHLKYEGLASRSVCGQEEGAEGGRGAMLRKALLPQELDITQGCQYMSVVKERSLEAEIHPERLKVNSGEIFHKMNFISVYPHHRSNRDEITTYHSKSSAVVDYIFYSNQNMEQVEKVDDGGGHRLPAAPEPLTLLARYKLMNYKHVRRIGFFPNSIFPSDHLCLIARFLLRTFIYL